MFQLLMCGNHTSSVNFLQVYCRIALPQTNDYSFTKQTMKIYVTHLIKLSRMSEILEYECYT